MNKDTLSVVMSFLQNPKHKINWLIQSFRTKHQIRHLLNFNVDHPDPTVEHEYAKVAHIFHNLYANVSPASKYSMHCSEISPKFWAGSRIHG